MELHKRKDYKQLRFGSPVAAMKTAQRFKESLGYKIVEPINANITSPGKKNTLSCYGLFYNRPEFRDEDWLYLLIELSEWKSVYSRKHYYSINSKDWYITGYSTDSSLEEPYAQYHPFGHSCFKYGLAIPLEFVTCIFKY